MSTWHVTAIERLGAPDPTWPSVYGPVAGVDPIAANALHTLDLSPYLEPLSDFTAQLERDLTTSSYSSMKLDLEDATGALADSLGPFSTTLATTTRYYGPWIQVWEEWTGGSALRFLGYLDETSLQWSEDEAKTQASVIHASQLLHERLITDFPTLLRPWPSVPTGTGNSFTQSTGDALLALVVPSYTPRSNAAAIESALWALGQLSWEAAPYKIAHQLTPTRTVVTYSACPAPVATSITIGTQTYAVDHVEWDTSLDANVLDIDERYYYHIARIYLQGAPNLTGILTLGATVTWAIPEAQRTHYLLKAGAIPAPATGSDGQRFVDLNTVEQLAVGDVLTLTFTDSTSGAPRITTADLPPIIDLDGEIGRAYIAAPLSQGYDFVSKVRRNSQDPVLFDGLAFARSLVAPFTLDTSAFVPAPTDVDDPVLAFQAYDAATPSLYGVHNLQTANPAGALRLSRRGSDDGTWGNYPTAGIWEGTWGGSWAWQGQPTADATHQILGDTLQFPGSGAPYRAPVIYTEGDLSGGATIPPNGWRPLWRSWQSLTQQSQDPQSTWNGTAITWAPATASGDVPALLVAYTASTPTPGRYALTAGTWSFAAHTADATLGTPVAPALTGTLPTGNWIALGMGIWASGSEQEALLGLVATGSAYPFTAMSAVLLSQAAGGDLTVRQTAALWSTGAIPAGPWALGGGLVVQSWTETIGGVAYPHTNLIKLNGSTVLTASLKTLEVIPGTIVPLHLTGAAGAQVISGWYCLALETFLDSNFAPARRLRFVHLDSSLTVLNGDPEPDPSTPTDIAAYFMRGEVVASLVPDGAILARMVRTSPTTDTMAGLVGGRLFTVASNLPTTVERLKIGATVPQGQILDVSHSGDGMAVSDYLEKFAAAQLATAVPGPDGNMALVSRSNGTLRLRADGTQYVSVLPSEIGKVTKTQAWQGYLRRVRVTYTDLLAGSTASVEVAATFDGGSILDYDVSDLVASLTMSRAIGRAVIYWMGQPAPVMTMLWKDRTLGVAGDLAPTWWADWRIGDRITLDPAAAGAQVTAWKLLKFQPAVEERAVQVELRQQPFTLTIPPGGGL